MFAVDDHKFVPGEEIYMSGQQSEAQKKALEEIEAKEDQRLLNETGKTRAQERAGSLGSASLIIIFGVVAMVLVGLGLWVVFGGRLFG